MLSLLCTRLAPDPASLLRLLPRSTALSTGLGLPPSFPAYTQHCPPLFTPLYSRCQAAPRSRSRSGTTTPSGAHLLSALFLPFSVLLFLKAVQSLGLPRLVVGWSGTVGGWAGRGQALVIEGVEAAATSC